jgi:hypothetical protein
MGGKVLVPWNGLAAMYVCWGITLTETARWGTGVKFRIPGDPRRARGSVPGLGDMYRIRLLG